MADDEFPAMNDPVMRALWFDRDTPATADDVSTIVAELVDHHHGVPIAALNAVVAYCVKNMERTRAVLAFGNELERADAVWVCPECAELCDSCATEFAASTEP